MRVSQNDDLFALISSAGNFPHALELEHREVVFLLTTREILSRSAFIDGRTPFAADDQEARHVSLDELISAFEASNSISAKPNANFIFHTGFCCSTLVARCLDFKGLGLSLKEPNILNDLSEAKRFGLSITKDRQNWDRVCGPILDLLFRRFSENEPVLVKATNVNNNLIEDVLRLKPKANVLFLSSDLKSFLISVAKGGKPRRDFIRRLVACLLTDLKNNLPADEQPLPFSENTLWALSDLHIAAVAWQLQMQVLNDIEKRFPNARIKKLDCEEFLADPASTTVYLSDFFGIKTGNSKEQKNRMEKNLSCHAKAQEFSYSPTIRQTEFMAIENYLGKTLEEILAWFEDFVVPSYSLTLPKVAI